MSNLTEAGRAFIPDVIKVPFDNAHFTMLPGGMVRIDMVHEKVSVWSVTKGPVKLGDCLVCGPFEAAIIVKTGLN